jgi:hypothetical protein
VKPLVARDGRLVLTTPNASSLTSLLVALSRRRELSHLGLPQTVSAGHPIGPSVDGGRE